MSSVGEHAKCACCHHQKALQLTEYLSWQMNDGSTNTHRCGILNAILFMLWGFFVGEIDQKITKFTKKWPDTLPAELPATRHPSNKTSPQILPTNQNDQSKCSYHFPHGHSQGDKQQGVLQTISHHWSDSLALSSTKVLFHSYSKKRDASAAERQKEAAICNCCILSPCVHRWGTLPGSVAMSYFMFPSACHFPPRSKGPHCHREAQPDEHGQAEHQRPDRVGAEPWPHPRLGLRTSPTVLCGYGALFETRAEKYVEKSYLLAENDSVLLVNRRCMPSCHIMAECLLLSKLLCPVVQPRRHSWGRTSLSGGRWSWWRS